MRQARRLRIFAGPNGSGKSTIIEYIRDNYRCGHYLNPDALESTLRREGRISLDDLGLSVRPAEFKAYLTESGWAKKLSADAVPKTLTCQRNYLVTAAPEHLAYDAAIACGFLTRCLLNAGETLSLETVLSHPSKVDILSAASDMGYKCYVYYICTQDVQINIDRVANRVRKGGHDVPRSKIRSRFAKSLSLLPEVIRTAYRAFLFDNSGSAPVLKVEFKNGRRERLHDDLIPGWVLEHAIKPLTADDKT